MYLILELRRNKNLISAFAVLSVLLFGANASYASHAKPGHRFAYRTQLGQDLDGDQLPETATIRESRHLFQVSIHFTSGRPKVRLSAYVTESDAGLSFQTTDINNDSKGDLVIISATSNRPVAIWLNQGKAKFQKVNPWFYGRTGRYTGPNYHLGGTSQPEPVGTLSVDPYSQATPAGEYFTFDDEVVDLITSQHTVRPFGSLLRQEPPRGPPGTERL